MKQLSIIIVNFNCSSFTKNCIKSLYGKNNAIPKTWETLLVDNGSKFEDKVQLERALRKLLPSKISLIENNENKGWAKANNRAIERSKGKYVLLLNPDAVVSQKAILQMVSFMDKVSDAGVSTAKVLLPSGKLDDACHRGFPTPWRAFCHFSKLGSLFPKSMLFNGYHLGYKDLGRIHEIDACAGAFMMVRRKVGEEIGWINEEYFWYGDDLDFCYRVKRKGYKIYFNPETEILHYKGVASGIKKESENITTADKATKRRAQKARFEAMKLFYSKHYKDAYSPLTNALVRFGITILEGYYKIVV